MAKVLVVEDDESIRSLIKLTLQQFQYETEALKMRKVHGSTCRRNRQILASLI